MLGIFNQAIEKNKLSATAQAIFFQLCNKASKAAWRMPIDVNEIALAEFLNLSQKDFYKAKQELCAAALISAAGTTGKKMRYTITATADSTSPAPARPAAPPEQQDDLVKISIMNSHEYMIAQRILAERQRNNEPK